MRQFRKLEKVNKTKLTAESEELRKLSYALLQAVEAEDIHGREVCAQQLREFFDKTELEEV